MMISEYEVVDIITGERLTVNSEELSNINYILLREKR